MTRLKQHFGLKFVCVWLTSGLRFEHKVLIKKRFWKNLVTQNAKRSLHFKIKMQYKFYLILLNSFRDPATQISIGVCII